MNAVSKVVLCLGLVGALFGCASLPPSPCTSAVVAGIEAKFAAAVVLTCPDAATRNQCAALPNLRAERAQAEKDASCH